jgi:protein-tyrosine sulfotransferase
MQQPIQVLGALLGGPERSGAGQPTALLPFSGPPPAGHPGEDREWLDPVFVSFAARSGSTLTRFLLDAHPDLACPPETNLPDLCARLARMRSLLTATPTAASLDEPVEVQGSVAAGIRRTVGMMIEPYLAKRGKQRYCDKSLHVAKHGELLLRVFPRARFMCLYRHPMDVIASGIEACPWGLKDFGFDPYAAGSPGNSVLAIARYWADYTATALALEEKYPERCHRVRYEDLVTDPETTASGIFEFIGVPQAPGISASCFAPDRERLGRGDFKIWNTSKITADSVGRGWSVPAFQIDPTVTARLNELSDRLGYARIERSWGAGPAPGDLRVPGGGQAAKPPAAGPAATRPMPFALPLPGEHPRRQNRCPGQDRAG